MQKVFFLAHLVIKYRTAFFNLSPVFITFSISLSLSLILFFIFSFFFPTFLLSHLVYLHLLQLNYVYLICFVISFLCPFVLISSSHLNLRIITVLFKYHILFHFFHFFISLSKCPFSFSLTLKFAYVIP